jgi:hypothetical protein
MALYLDIWNYCSKKIGKVVVMNPSSITYQQRFMTETVLLPALVTYIL